MDSNDLRQVRDMIEEAMKKVAQFSTRKLGDTPTDGYQLTPLKFVTANGSVAGRPMGSVASIGQFYLATDTGIPMWRTATNWVNGVGSVVCIN